MRRSRTGAAGSPKCARDRSGQNTRVTRTPVQDWRRLFRSDGREGGLRCSCPPCCRRCGGLAAPSRAAAVTRGRRTSTTAPGQTAASAPARASGLRPGRRSHRWSYPATRISAVSSASSLEVSVVVCAYTLDRWSDIVAGIEALGSQTLPPLEMLLVVDGNPELLGRAQDAFPHVRA